MKRTALRTRKAPAIPAYLAARAPWDRLAQSFDDDIDEDLVDYDDEREAVDLVLHGTTRSVN
jgi:hypothetical protein